MDNQFADVQKSATQLLQGLQKLGQLNVQFLQSSLADATSAARTLMTAKTPEEFAALCASEFKSAPDKANAYGRQVRDILTASSHG